LSAKIHGLQERQSVALPRCVVVGAEGRGHVHDTRSLLRRNERLADYYLVLALFVLHPIEWTLVAFSDESVAAKRSHRLPTGGEIVTQDRGHTSESEYHCLAGVSLLFPELHILERRIDCQCDVRNERPRRCRP